MSVEAYIAEIRTATKQILERLDRIERRLGRIEGDVDNIERDMEMEADADVGSETEKDLFVGGDTPGEDYGLPPSMAKHAKAISERDTLS